MVLPDQNKTVEPSGFSDKTKIPDRFAVPLNRRLEAEEEEEEEDEGERERELVGAATIPVLQEQIMLDESPNPALPSPPPQVGQKQTLPDQLAPRPSDSTIAVRPDIPKLERQDSTMEIEEVQSARSPSYTSGETNRNREGKRKASDAEGVSPSPVREAKRHREESEPAEEEDQGPSSGQTRKRRPTGTSDRVADKRFQNVIGMLHSQISQHRNGNIFHNPIKNSEAPDYHEIIKRPMDLKSIKAKIKDGVISTSLEFQRDVYLMFANAMMYNRPGSDIYHMAEDMMIESEVHINTFRQTEGFVRSTHR
ncbi:hypothetical protein SERLADRAFT_382647 [Serpula lacrymans var. lacrymans S7.9]|uniref:Bromo domain-containing protein n=1 Tax=Serpula lacrymans var. lacrymans (strain S7.9) TaxID=578457 RepID=F8NNB8_SERL9|nr:uncharacterized protein SERLADRAFT_382647 [Serpula lacrymans var. lacrymans S7.9]EGO27548.1 hypothetical protein SERLADRAFT_382647 [Serpula lacrymans var. lacrymans S7.9]